MEYNVDGLTIQTFDSIFVQKNKKPHELIQWDELNAVELDSDEDVVLY
jgi:hypothetical protein